MRKYLPSQVPEVFNKFTAFDNNTIGLKKNAVGWFAPFLTKKCRPVRDKMTFYFNPFQYFFFSFFGIQGFLMNQRAQRKKKKIDFPINFLMGKCQKLDFRHVQDTSRTGHFLYLLAWPRLKLCQLSIVPQSIICYQTFVYDEYLMKKFSALFTRLARHVQDICGCKIN